MSSATEKSNQPHRVVIIGGGFGGLYAAIALRKANVGITLIDRRNFHLFQPLLYQVATGGLSPANIATPLRSILSRQKNCEVVLGEVSTIDVAAKMVIVGHNAFEYDSLVVAAGASHAYFGHDEWEPLAPGLKTIEDATNIRCRILAAFEAAEIEADPIKRAAWMTFLVVGGGPTGVELTGALSELAHHTLKHDYRNINPSDAKIILVNASDRVLMPYPEDLSAAAMESLESRNVEVMLDTKLTGVYPDFVVVETPQGVRQIPTKTTLWAAGVKASALGQQLAAASGEPADRTGRVIVQPDLSLALQPEIFVIGDMASSSHQTGKPLPGVASVAMQQGNYVADVIRRRLAGKPATAFHYRDYGSMATIGRGSAVAMFGKRRFSGIFAWLIWLFVHVLKLAKFENRVLVLLQWAWHYTTWNQAARLITQSSASVPKKT
ncbi:MAG: NAD(P)/FAD-dependent oxidoreductase [Fuerstiella sp.]